MDLEGHVAMSMVDHVTIMCQKLELLGEEPSKKKNELGAEASKRKDDVRAEVNMLKEEVKNYKQMMTRLESQVSLLTTLVGRPTSKSEIQFFWQIKNWAALEAKTSIKPYASATSDDFFTGQYGYRLRARIYPGGVGDGKGTHLSALLKLFPGPYDDLLPWPFGQDFRFTVMNMLDRKHDQRFTIKASSYMKGSCFSRPVDLREGNVGTGKVTFIPHDVLHQPGFILNDTLTVIVNVVAMNAQI